MSTPAVEAPAPIQAKPARPWFKKKRFILPILGVAFIIIASSAGGGSTGSAPLPQAPAAQAPVAEAPVAPAPVAEAPAPEPAASTCDVVREALLTGTPATVAASMKALIADKTAPATAREYARYYTVRDKGNKDLQAMDESLITMSCSS